MDREFYALRAELESLKEFIITAVPFKGCYFILNGVGATEQGLDPEFENATAPVFVSEYNITPPPVRISKGVDTPSGLYEFTMDSPTIQGVNILDFLYPIYDLVIPPGNQPVDTKIFSAEIVSATPATGVFRIQIKGGFEEANGKLTFKDYDLRGTPDTDAVFFTGQLSLRSSTVAANSLAKFNLNDIIGDLVQ